MNLNEYEWSRNPRGMHQATFEIDIPLMARHRMGWIKIVALGQANRAAADAMASGMTPVVRVYRERPGNSPVDEGAYNQYRSYRDMGVKWFEYYNEPNLGVEWPQGAAYDPRSLATIQPLMDNWMTWAEWIISIGGYPNFPALSDVNTGSNEDTIAWIDGMLGYLKQNHYERFRNIINNGLYIATHPYIYNHFYQERAGGGARSARPANAVNVSEGGWHFEYPYDPICQYDDPGRTVRGGTALAPYGDTVSLLGSASVIMATLQAEFGVGAIPVVSTEGGIFAPGFGPPQADNRYPPVTTHSHAHGTLAMFEWISTVAPAWMFGVCLWKFDDYYRREDGFLPVAGLFEQRAPIMKDVPAIPALTDAASSATPPPVIVLTPDLPGPGPIHGYADYQFVFLAPSFESDWFFAAAEAYWDAFKPVLVVDLEFIEFLPSNKSLVVTAITTPDMIEWIETSITPRWPNVFIDFILVEQPDDLARELSNRVAVGRRFG